jgi:PAS domain S-box-containing protein
MKITLRARLVLLVLVAIVPLFGLSMVEAWRHEDDAISRASDNLKVTASLLAADQDRVVASAYQMLLAIANAPGLAEGKTADCQRYLKTLKDQLPVYGNLGFMGLDGYFLCHSLGNGTIPFAGDRDYFQQVLARRAFVAGGYFMGRATGKPIVPFAMPVMNSEGKVSAVAFASVDLKEMSKALADAPLPPDARLVIMDRQGIVLVASPPNPAMVGQQVPSPFLQDAVKTMRAGVGEGLDGEGRQRIFAFLPTGKSSDSPFFVAVSLDRAGVISPARKELGLELMFLALLAFLGGWLAWMIGGRVIVKPTTELLEATRQVQQGRMDVRIPIRAGDDAGEFSRIAAGFNRMAESLQTQRDALEAELARSQTVQEKLQDAQRLGRIGYWQSDLDTRMVWWSDEVYDVLGVDRVLLGNTFDGFLQRVHPDDREAYGAGRDGKFRSGLPRDIEYRVITSAGEVRWIHQFGRAHVNAEGEQGRRRAGVLQDITERKLAELAIARNTEMLKRTGALAKVGGWELTMETMTLCWSDENYRIRELEPGAGIGLEDAIGSFAPEAQPVIRAAIEAGIKNASSWDLELPMMTARGRRIWVRTQGCAMLQDGKVVRLVGALQDITEQHESQAQMRLLETCISHLNDMVVVADAGSLEEPGLRIVFVNDAFERRTGYSREEVLGKAPGMMGGPNTQQVELDRVRAALQKWQPVRVELINYTKSGEEFWLELDIVPIFDSKGGLTHWVAVERDITQRKLAEQALIDSEQRYAALFEAAPVPMWVYDIATAQFLAVNKAAIQGYGYSAKEFLAMTIFGIRPEAEHGRLRQLLAEVALERKVSSQHRRKDASIFPVDAVSKPIHYAGRAARLVVALDITAQVKAEKDMQDYLFTLQRATDAAQAITWHHTLQGTLQEVAEQARGVIGAHQAVISLTTGGNWTQAIHALSLSEKYAKYRDLIEPVDGSGIYALVCENNRPLRMTQAELEAHPRWRGFGSYAGKHPAMRGWLAVPLTGRDGNNIGLLQLSDKYEGEFTQQDEYVALELAQLAAIAIDNARLIEEVGQLNVGLEKKVAERTVALARQEALFRAVAEQAPQVVWTKDPDGNLTYFNRAWLGMMGGRLEDWTGSTQAVYAAVHPDDLPDVKARWEAARASRSDYAGIRRLWAKDGSYHTTTYRASPVLDKQGELAFWVGIDSDITEIKAIEAALRLSNQELEAFSYSVSHDLRSPLNTIGGFSQLLVKQLGDIGNDKARHYLSRIQAGVAQMGQLITDLLSLAQVSRTQLRHEPVDLSALARSILGERQARQPERQVALHIESGLLAQGDTGLVRVVMDNLLGNAWKFSSQQAQAEISVGQKTDAAGLPVFFVRDNGAGFDMAYADKLFNPFQRLHAVSEFPGTGIGLATASRVIARHGGQLWADAAPGRGATFFFTLPKVPVAV